MIPAKDIEKIKETARIEEVVGDYVQLRNRGSNKLGLCPFHNEKTPSFTVSPAKGIYKCFGCGKSGNSISFVMEHEQLSFPEALRQLAKKYNIELNEVQSEEAKAQRNLFESLYIINKFVQKYYSKNMLESDEGRSVGLSYFKSRGFLDVNIEKFQLGYSMDSFDHLIKAASAGKYNEDYLIKLGLIGNKNNRKYDFFRGRVMFPIHNLSGKVIAFAGRTLSSDKKVPKYVNSPESEVYYKSKILYGAYQAKSSISKLDNCYLVEGYTDVISMHQAGIENVVASSGTSLTKDQIQLIKRFTKNVTVLYDGDMAGINAAIRGTDMILEADMNVRVVLLPDGEDPDSFVQAKGAEGFSEFVQTEGKDFVFFKTKLLLEQSEGDPVKKTALIRSIVETLARIPDPIKRSLYIRECSQLLKISEQIIINETNKVKRKKVDAYNSEREKTVSAPISNSPSNPPNFPNPDIASGKTVPIPDYQAATPENRFDKQIHKLEFEFVELFLNHSEKPIAGVSSLQWTFNELEEVGLNFQHPICIKVVDLFKEKLSAGEIATDKFFLEHEDNEIMKFCSNILLNQQEVSANWAKMYQIPVKQDGASYKDRFVNLVGRFKLVHIQKLVDENQERIKNTSDPEEMGKCLQIHQTLLKYQNDLSKELGSVIIR